MNFDLSLGSVLKITWVAFSKYKFPATLSPIDLDSLKHEPQELNFMWFVSGSKTEKQRYLRN